MTSSPQEQDSFDPKSLERPAPQLLTYYLLQSIFAGPAIVFALPYIWFRYQTLRYTFEESGMRMRVGLIFQKEVVTAYRRIQDIHVTSNIVQRWLGISTVSIQTASGSALPEIVLEGVTNPESVRDWLYARLRGARGETTSTPTAQQEPTVATATEKEVSQLLSEIRDNLATLARNKQASSEQAS